MIQKWNRYAVLQQFFDNPRKAFFIRELSRRIGIAVTAIRQHLNALLEEGLIKKTEGGLYPAFTAARDNPLFKLLKVQDIACRLHESGMISALEKKLYPSCIVLYGSASRGEDNEQSDIDIFVQAHRADIPLAPFEKLLHRKIHLLFEQDMQTLSAELRNNLANGTVLYGYLKVL